jgi:glycopeptide antibiotics resistance protein
MSPRSPALRPDLTAALWALLLGVVLLAPASMLESAGGSWYRIIPGDLVWADKLIHAVLFAVMAWLLHSAFVAAASARPALKAFAISALYGLLLDLLQGFIPERATELLDILANVLGAAAGAWLASKRSRPT